MGYEEEMYMGRKKESVPSIKQIVEYWKDKYISKNFEIIDFYEEGAEPVITDLGEPECWACGMFNENIYENLNYDKLLQGKNVIRVWSLPEVKYLQKAHILSKMLGGENKPSNYFLLCKTCHQESPDFSDTHYFYAYICHTRKYACRIRNKRSNEIQRAVYELANLMNKNILTIDKGIKNIESSVEKMGLHITSFSLYTMASAIVYGMDNLDYEILLDEDINKIKDEYLKFEIEWHPKRRVYNE